MLAARELVRPSMNLRALRRQLRSDRPARVAKMTADWRFDTGRAVGNFLAVPLLTRLTHSAALLFALPPVDPQRVQ